MIQSERFAPVKYGDTDPTDVRACTGCVCGARRVRSISFVRAIKLTFACVLLNSMIAVARFGELDSSQQMQGIDEQVQEIKSDVVVCQNSARSRSEIESVTCPAAGPPDRPNSHLSH